MAMKEYSRASDAYQKALEIDSNCQEALEGYKRYSKAVFCESSSSNTTISSVNTVWPMTLDMHFVQMQFLKGH